MSATEESLSSIFANDAAPAEVPSTTGETVEAKTEVVVDTKTAPPADTKDPPKDEAKGQARDEAGKFTAKVDPPAEEKPPVNVAGIIDERRKRQAAEARVRELEQQGGAKAKPSVLDDEDAAFTARIDEGTRGLREQNYHLSVRLARIEHGDVFGQAEEAFAAAAQNDDRLIAGLRASNDPGEYIYSLGTQIRELADVGGDLGKYRQKITAQSTAQITDLTTRNKALEAEVERLTKLSKDIEALPRSLNSKSSGAAPKAGEEDDENLSTITRFGHQSR